MRKRADALTERHSGMNVTIRGVTGRLDSTHTCKGITTVELNVGGLRSWWALLPETEVEVSSA
jgi:hypothetical protein